MTEKKLLQHNKDNSVIIQEKIGDYFSKEPLHFNNSNIEKALSSETKGIRFKFVIIKAFRYYRVEEEIYFTHNDDMYSFSPTNIIEMTNLLTRERKLVKRIDIFKWYPQIDDIILNDGIYGEQLKITDIFGDSYECKSINKHILKIHK